MLEINIRFFGGRGGFGGGAGGGSGRGSAKEKTSSDGAISYSDRTLKAERITGYGNSGTVLEAKTDGKGNLTLEYATPTGYRQQNSKTSYAQYEIKAGITDLNENGKWRDGITSVNINWDKVKTVSGKTYGTQRLMRENGFTWNGTKKIWEKK